MCSCFVAEVLSWGLTNFMKICALFTQSLCLPSCGCKLYDTHSGANKLTFWLASVHFIHLTQQINLDSTLISLWHITYGEIIIWLVYRPYQLIWLTLGICCSSSLFSCLVTSETQYNASVSHVTNLLSSSSLMSLVLHL